MPTHGPCEHAGCTRDYVRLRHGRCYEHRTGFMCTADGCTSGATVAKLCGRHYSEKRRRDQGVRPRKQATVRCSVADCRKKHHARGLCIKHYQDGRRTPVEVIETARPTRGHWDERPDVTVIHWPSSYPWTCPHCQVSLEEAAA